MNQNISRSPKTFSRNASTRVTLRRFKTLIVINLNLIVDHVYSRGGTEAISFLLHNGGSPLLTNGTFDEEKFELQTFFDNDPYLALRLFFGHEVNRCTYDPDGIFLKHSPEALERHKSRSGKVCLKLVYHWYIAESKKKDLLRMMQLMNFNKTATEVAVDNLLKFRKFQFNLVFYSESSPDFELTKIKDIGKRFPEFKVNWLKAINSQLLSHSQLSEDDEILFENINVVTKILEALSAMNQK